MSFSVGDTITDATERLTTSAAARLIAAMTVVGVVQTAALQDILRGFLEWTLELLDDPEVREELSASEIETFEEQVEAIIADLPLAMGLSPGVAALVWLVAFVVALAIVVVAIDTFANERDGFDGIETEGIGRKTLHLFLGWIAFAVLFAIGFALFVLPGLLVALFLFYFTAAIVVDDESFVGAFGTSYRVVRSSIASTIGIILLGLGAFVAVWFVGGIFGAGVSGAAGEVVAELITSVGQVFIIALVTRAYVDATRDATEDPVGEGADWETGTEPESQPGSGTR